jgi:hypothetical protein
MANGYLIGRFLLIFKGNFYVDAARHGLATSEGIRMLRRVANGYGVKLR